MAAYGGQMANVELTVDEPAEPEPVRPQLVIGPARSPWDIPLEPPIAIMVSRADRQWIDRMRHRAR